jgi:hypothetical protein
VQIHAAFNPASLHCMLDAQVFMPCVAAAAFDACPFAGYMGSVISILCHLALILTAA